MGNIYLDSHCIYFYSMLFFKSGFNAYIDKIILLYSIIWTVSYLERTLAPKSI